MIEKDEIAEVVRYNDAESEEFQDMPRFWEKRGVNVQAVMDVAQQRGLRVVMIRQGRSPNLTKPTNIALSRAERQDEMQFASMWMDGFAAGFDLARRQQQS